MQAIKDQLSIVAEYPERGDDEKTHPEKDEFGSIHLLLVKDLKQLPPATSRPHFLAADGAIFTHFRFRMLRQNRRIVTSADPMEQKSLDDFHTVLEDIAFGMPTPLVKDFLIRAYVRGAKKTQANVGFEESIACFTKRRYRDAWNRAMQGRSAKEHNRALRVKAVFAPRGTTQQWISG